VTAPSAEPKIRVMHRRWVDRAIYKIGNPDSEAARGQRRIEELRARRRRLAEPAEQRSASPQPDRRPPRGLQAILDTCSICHEPVGRNALAITLPPGSNAGTFRFSVGRYRACAVCVAEHELIVRVPARDGSPTGRAPAPARRGAGIVINPEKAALRLAAERDSADEDDA